MLARAARFAKSQLVTLDRLLLPDKVPYSAATA
jgi:hypothetical protein